MYNWIKIMGIGAIIVGLLALGGCGTNPSPTTLAPGSLQGVISDASTGAPIAEAQVSIAGQVGVFTVMSDASGKYQVSDLPPGAYLISVQATGYYVNAAQVGVVANVRSDGNVMLEPDAVSVVVVTATPAPTTPPSPTMTATPTPTPTTTPRPTALPSITPTATRTPAPPTPTPSPMPAPTRRSGTVWPPASNHTAPELREPLNGSVFKGPRRITFGWTGTCCALGANEYYVVSIPHPQGVEEAWVKGNRWDAPLYLYLLVPESRQLTWNVSVRRHTGQYPNGQWTGPIVSQISEIWYFTWLSDEGGPVSPLSPPNSPLSAP